MLHSYLIALPIHGLSLSDSGELPARLFDRPWTLIGKEQFKALKELPQESDSLGGNIQMIQDRLAPDAFLMYRGETEIEPTRMFEAYDAADTVVAALCMISLLSQEPYTASWSDEPRPVFRARFREHCDLPLAFDRARVIMVGHSSSVSWSSVGPRPRTKAWTAGAIDAYAQSSLEVIQKALRLQPSDTQLQAELTASMRALAAAFQATTIGQFAASAIAAIECLVGTEDLWNVKATRIGLLAGTEYGQRVGEVLQARHDFVHEARQPPAKLNFLAQTAAAIAVQVWDRVARLPPSISTLEDLLYYLRGVAGADPLTLPADAARRLDWVHKYLLPTHPNDYHLRYVVNGRANCPDRRCGHLVTDTSTQTQSGPHARLTCHMCGTNFTATIRS